MFHFSKPPKVSDPGKCDSAHSNSSMGDNGLLEIVHETRTKF